MSSPQRAIRVNTIVTYIAQFCFLKKSDPPPQPAPRKISSLCHCLVKMAFRCLSAGCGGAMTTLTGTILSPNYPSAYPDNLYCSWLITVRPGRTVVLTFDDFKLHPEPHCSKDYVAVSAVKKYCPRGFTKTDSCLIGPVATKKSQSA